MSLSDPVADMLTTIRNGQMVKLATVSCPSSNIKKDILAVLKAEGYVAEYVEETIDESKKRLNITLRYHRGEAVIKKIKRVSKPGLRVYVSIDDLPRYYNGLGIAILSTSQGVVADHQARSANVGGEVLCNVF